MLLRGAPNEENPAVFRFRITPKAADLPDMQDVCATRSYLDRRHRQLKAMSAPLPTGLARQ